MEAISKTFNDLQIEFRSLEKVKKDFKFYLRLIIAIVVGVPTLPIAYFACSAFGLFMIIPVYAVGSFVCGWLLNDDDLLEMSKEGFGITWILLLMPFLMWYEFVKGEKIAI